MRSNWNRISGFVGAVAAVFALGLWVFARETPRIAENL